MLDELVGIKGIWHGSDKRGQYYELFFTSFSEAKQFVDSHDFELFSYNAVDSLNGMLVCSSSLEIDVGQYKIHYGMMYKKDNFVEKNKPLTLEQLRRMDGKPVFVVWVGHSADYWCILKIYDYAEEDSGAYLPGNDNFYFSIKEYGTTWTAFDREPKGDYSND